MAMELQLEHAIGLNCSVPRSVHQLKGERVSLAGDRIVLTSTRDQRQTFLSGHTNQVTCVMPSRTGRLLASGQAGKGDVVVWDMASRKELYRFSEHVGAVACVTFSEDERFLATLGDPRDGQLLIFDMKTGKMVARALTNGGSSGGRNAGSTLVEWGPRKSDQDGKLTSSIVLVTAMDGMLYFWDLDVSTGSLVGHPAKQLKVRRQYTCFAWSADRKTLFAGSSSGDVGMFDLKDRVLIGEPASCSGGVWSLVVLDGSLYLGGGDGTVTVFEECGPGQYVDRLQSSFGGRVQSMSLSADQGSLLLATAKGSVYTVHARDLSGPELQASTHSSDVTAMVAVPGSAGCFVTTGSDGSVRVWSLKDYSCLAAAELASPPLCVAATEGLLLLGCKDGAVRCLDLQGREQWTLPCANRNGVKCIALGHSGKFFVTGGVMGEVRVWDLESKTMMSELLQHSQTVNGLALFEDDLHLLSCSKDRSFVCWDLPGEKKISSHAQRMGGIHAIAHTKDDIVSVGQEKRVSFWDLRESAAVHVVSPHEGGEMLALSVSGDGALVAVGGTERVASVWDAGSKERFATATAHSDLITSLAFTPNRDRLISAGKDCNIMIWKMG